MYYRAGLTLDSVATYLWGKSWRSKSSFPLHDTVEGDYIFVDARPWNPAKKPQDWTIKVYGQDTLYRYLGDEYQQDHTLYVKKYAIEAKRRVLMVRWNAPDILELRVPSDESRQRIDGWGSRLWQMMKQGLQKPEFIEWDLSVARRNLISQWEKTPAYQKMYSFRDTLLVDPYATAASFQPNSPQGNLFSSIYAKAAVNGLLESNSECAQITITWQKREGEPPFKNLNTELGLRRKTNELIVREHCSAMDLDYVTEQLRHFNRKAT